MFKLLANWLRPDRIYRSIDTIDFSALQREGIRLVLLDIDNTLVRHGSRQPDDYARAIILSIQNAGLIPFVVSNARASRARAFASELGIDGVGLANKPAATGLVRACHQTGIAAAQTVMIGDQLFTDILAARRAHVLKILVEPLDAHEVWNVACKRWFEAPFLRIYAQDATLWPDH